MPGVGVQALEFRFQILEEIVRLTMLGEDSVNNWVLSRAVFAPNSIHSIVISCRFQCNSFTAPQSQRFFNVEARCWVISTLSRERSATLCVLLYRQVSVCTEYLDSFFAAENKD